MSSPNLQHIKDQLFLRKQELARRAALAELREKQSIEQQHLDEVTTRRETTEVEHAHTLTQTTDQKEAFLQRREQLAERQVKTTMYDRHAQEMVKNVAIPSDLNGKPLMSARRQPIDLDLYTRLMSSGDGKIIAEHLYHQNPKGSSASPIRPKHSATSPQHHHALSYASPSPNRRVATSAAAASSPFSSPPSSRGHDPMVLLQASLTRHSNASTGRVEWR